MYRLAGRVYYLSIFSMSMSMDVDNCHLNGLCSSEASASCRIELHHGHGTAMATLHTVCHVHTAACSTCATAASPRGYS